MSESNRGPSEASTLRQGALRLRASSVVLALIVLVGSALAFLQGPRFAIDAVSSPGPTELGWWLYPLEAEPSDRLPSISGSLGDVAITPEGEVLAVGDGGLLLRSTDAGVTWKQTPIMIARVAEPAIKAAVPAAAKGVQQAPLRDETPDAAADSPFTGDLVEIQVARRGEKPSIILGSRGGNLLTSTEAGRSWVIRANPLVKPGTRSVSALAAEHPVEFDRSLPPGGASWFPKDHAVLNINAPSLPAGPVPWDTRAAAVASGDEGRLEGQAFAVGGHGGIATIYRSVDGGRTWIPATRLRLALYGNGRLWPAPWYAVLLLVVLVAVGLTRRQPPYTEVRGIDDTLVSDAPLTAKDAARFAGSSTAYALSAFLRNEKTDPPLTIAITGAWGSGKSSLMNVLKEDVETCGFRPVWFNAWHHQQEEHLLAALLESVRSQAVPPWWTWSGLVFRCRLLHRRSRRWLILSLALLLLAGFPAGSYLRNGMASLRADIESLHGVWSDVLVVFSGEAARPPGIESVVKDVMQLVEQSMSQAKAASAPPVYATRPVAAMVAALVLVGMLLRGLRAFGVNPAELMASASKRGSISDLGAQAGFRHQFANEFADVTAALRPRTLMIFIDDLDRCQPDNVLKVLEAVNFLVSSGKCFLVLGMDRERVVPAVAVGFESLLDYLPADVDADGKEDGKEVRLRRHAELYLEKLINIEVPVPVVGDRAGIIAPLEQPPAVSVPLRPWWWRGSVGLTAAARAAWRVPGVVPILALAMTITLGYWMAAPSTRLTVEPTVPATAEVTSSSTVEDPEAPMRPESGTPATIISDHPAGGHRWELILVGMVLALGTVLAAAGTRSDVVVRDSPAFAKALAIWKPAVNAHAATPRVAKRLLNRIRYYAMCQREHRPFPSYGQRALAWLRGLMGKEGPTIVPYRSDRIPDEALVAIGVMTLVDPQWAAHPNHIGVMTLKGELGEVGVVIDGCLRVHRETFTDPRVYAERFAAMSATITT